MKEYWKLQARYGAWILKYIGGGFVIAVVCGLVKKLCGEVLDYKWIVEYTFRFQFILMWISAVCRWGKGAITCIKERNRKGAITSIAAITVVTALMLWLVI